MVSREVFSASGLCAGNQGAAHGDVVEEGYIMQ